MYIRDEADCSFDNLLVRADCKTIAVLPVYELDIAILCAYAHTHLKHYKSNFQMITQAWSVLIS